MEQEEEIRLLLVKYIAGQANDKEVAVIKSWINAHPENEQYFAQLYEAWQNSLVLNRKVVDTSKAYQLFENRINGGQPFIRKTYKPWMAVVVAIAVIISSTWLFSNHHAATRALSQLAAKPGNIQKITLTDGTVVWLNAGSMLKYGDEFGKTNREVYLEGEAFFEIAPGKKDIPFIVNAKKYIVRDIGTRFNIKAYSNDPFFETSVVTGEVSVENKEDKEMNLIHIKQKQTLRIWNRRSSQSAEAEKFITAHNNNYNEIQITQFEAGKEDNYIGWKDDLLVFDNNSLQDIARVLERRYAVKINISDSVLHNIKYSGSFKNVNSINRVLDIIQQNTPVSYTRLGDSIIITKDR